MTTRSKSLHRTQKAYGHDLWSIFNKLKKIPGENVNIRKDKYGVLIHFEHYGNQTKETGWHVDHIDPQSKFPERSQCFSNLCALSHIANLQKGNKYDHLDKKNHLAMLNANPKFRQRRNDKKYTRPKLKTGEIYNVYLTPRVKESRVCKVLEICHKKVSIEFNGEKYWVYNDPILFEYAFVRLKH
jgi:hypothetical protein